MARHSTDKHQFRYLVVLDFEATCNEPQNPSPQEVIEWPAMIIDIKNKCILKNSFHYYLKPIIHPKLSRFCTNLTGITQPMVNNGDNIFNVITKWNEFCYENNLLPNNKNKPLSCMVTCGDWDLKIMWPMQSKIVKQNILNNNSFKLILCNWTRLIQLRSEIINTIQLYYNENILLTPSLFHSWINIKDIYEQKYNKRAGGMMRCLKNLGIKHVGRHHSGIDDVKNICNIALKLLNDGAIFNCYKLNDISNDIIIKQHMIDGYIANYNQINTEIITTNMDRNKYITEYEVDEDKANDACNRCGKTGHWARECPKPKNNNDVCNRCGGRGHWAMQCTNKRNNNDTCNRCGKSGHWARECSQPFNKNNNNNNNDKCNRCGKRGHWARDCKLPFNRNNNNNDKCNRCGGRGHWARDCKQPRNNNNDKCNRCGGRGHWARDCKQSFNRNNNNDQCNRCGQMGHWARDCKQPRNYQ